MTHIYKKKIWRVKHLIQFSGLGAQLTVPKLLEDNQRLWFYILLKFNMMFYLIFDVF